MRLGEKVTCREFIEFLADYLDGELPPERHEIFQAHLGLCDACVDYLRTYEDTVLLTKATADDPVPEEVPDTLVKAILAARVPKA
jgi:anti-sigma factor RsiW